MFGKPIVQVVAIVLSLVAAFICFDLLKKHVSGSSGHAWFDQACSAEDGGLEGADCDEVLKSPYGVFPFIDPRKPEGEASRPEAEASASSESAVEGTSSAEEDPADLGGEVLETDTESPSAGAVPAPAPSKGLEPEAEEPGGETAEPDLPAPLRLVFAIQSAVFKEDAQRTPVALIGMIYYCMIAVWLAGVGRPTPDMRWLHGILVGIAVCSFLGCLFFIYLMFSKMDAWCPMCLATHGLNLLTLICIVLLWPGRRMESQLKESIDAKLAEEAEEAPQRAVLGAGAARQNERQEQLRAALTPSSPGLRQLAATLIAVYLVGFGLFQMYGRAAIAGGAQNSQKVAEQCLAKLEEYQADGKKLLRMWRLEDEKEITLRADESIRGGVEGHPGLKVIVFSDLQCPACRRFALFLEDEVQKLFDGNLKIIYKHYPLDKSCNAIVKSSMHPQACQAAAFAESARLQLGNEGFWKAHDYFYADPRRLNNMSATRFCEALGLDLDRFKKDWEDKAFASRIYEDITQGQKMKLRATPSVFVTRREVPSLAKMSIEFWDEMANTYWRAIKERRPEHTKLKNIKK